jgi:putative FmdB family regulatory protein
MPFYEYECPSCRYYAEVMQKISDTPLKKCPSCGKSGFKRLISAPVFRLKGSGWYETDFKSDKDKQRNLVGEREEAKPAESAKATDADAKPAAEKSTVADAKNESAKPAPVAGNRRNTSAPAKHATARRAPVRKRAAARKPK